MPVIHAPKGGPEVQPTKCNLKFKVEWDTGEKIEMWFANLRPDLVPDLIAWVRERYNTEGDQVALRPNLS